MVIPTELIKGEFALIVYNVCNHKLPISGEYYNRIYIYIYSEKYVFQFSKNQRIMERNNGKWNFDEKRSDTRASIERYIFDSFDSSKNTGLMKLGNFPFTLLENLRENSPGE